MNKEFFLAVTNHIAVTVPQIKWVDADEGQLYVAGRPPLAFPACLVDISYPQCESLSGGKPTHTCTGGVACRIRHSGQYECCRICFGARVVVGTLRCAGSSP